MATTEHLPTSPSLSHSLSNLHLEPTPRLQTVVPSSCHSTILLLQRQLSRFRIPIPIHCSCFRLLSPHRITYPKLSPIATTYKNARRLSPATRQQQRSHSGRSRNDHCAREGSTDTVRIHVTHLVLYHLTPAPW